MRFLSSLVLLALVAVPAVAQPPWYARGSFNNWSTGSVQDETTPFPMVVDPGNSTHYTQKITGLFDNVGYNWKIATSDWGVNMPTTDSSVTTNALGEINFHLWDQTSWNDGWSPNNVRRVGYEDSQMYDWEVIGNFNNWRDGGEPGVYMTDLGNGLHQLKKTFNAGDYEFKFRSQDAWTASVGGNFGNGANNNLFHVGTDGDEWTFELDLPNGRWRAFTNAVAPIQVGDYNDNGKVDAADFTLWRNAFGTNTVLKNDPIGGLIGNQQYANWKTHFGEGSEDHWIVRSTQLGDQLPVSLGGGKYKLDMTELTAGTDYEFRFIRSNDASTSYPGSAMKVRANVDGDIHLNFQELPAGGFTDGWSPSNAPRVGYVDSQQFDWQLMGSYNGWTGDAAFNLTDQGNGLHTGVFSFAVGTHQFKFRQVDDWNTSVGDDFGNSANNNSITVASASEQWHFELDLPNGRWRAYAGAGAGSVSAVPEPSAIVMALVGLLVSLAAAPRRR